MRGKKKKRLQAQARAQAQVTAVWTPDPNTQMFVFCSACNFRIETARAVETGWTAREHVALRYRFCPVCGRYMLLYGQNPEQTHSDAAAAASECENITAGPEETPAQT